MVKAGAYRLTHIKECNKCSGVMVSRGHRLNLSCSRCELNWKYELEDVCSVGVKGGLPTPEEEEDFDTFKSKIATSSNTKELDHIPRNGPLYFVLSKGEQCPVVGCAGYLKKKGGGLTVQYSCGTCDFKTVEKDVS